jgi:hypothetical protein
MLANDYDAGQMEIPPRNSAESSYSLYSDLASSGYTNEPYEFSDVLSLENARRSLRLEDGRTTGALYRIRHFPHWQDKDLRLAIGFNFGVNFSQGVIFARLSASADGVPVPEDLLNQANIRVRHWSDVVFLHLLHMSESEPKNTMTNLRYIFRNNITNKDTLKVIKHILHRRNRVLRVWPGDTLDMNTPGDVEDIKALIGTPNGIGVAYLLLQHKRALGHKFVYRINLFLESEPNIPAVQGNPSLLMHIKDV